MGPLPQRRQWLWTMTHLGLCAQRTMEFIQMHVIKNLLAFFLDKASWPDKQKPPNTQETERSTFSAPSWCLLFFRAGQLPLSSLSGQFWAVLKSGWHLLPEGWWEHQDQPILAQWASTGRWVPSCPGPHTLTAPQTLPTQAPHNFWMEDHLSQIQSLAQHCGYCEVYFWVPQSAFSFSFPS